MLISLSLKKAVTSNNYFICYIVDIHTVKLKKSAENDFLKTFFQISETEK
jgi:hypothetical protein